MGLPNKLGQAVPQGHSVLPTMFGESVVMRVLDRSVVSLDRGSVVLIEPARFDEVLFLFLGLAG